MFENICSKAKESYLNSSEFAKVVFKIDANKRLSKNNISSPVGKFETIERISTRVLSRHASFKKIKIWGKL
jgi:hypothetical protein